MIGRLSEKLVTVFIEKSVIDEEEKELYIYGFFMLISKLFLFLVALSCGVVFGVVLEGVIFFVVFMLVREYAGGYHASTELRCQVMTSLCLMGFIFAIRLFSEGDIELRHSALGAASFLCIVILSPLDSPEKPLTSDERKKYKNYSAVIAVGVFLTMLLSRRLNIIFLFYPCLCALVFESCLLVTGSIKRKMLKK